ncbi:LysR family transcriptional regulator [Dasania marina]|uniref:LysR family transcriptional regulator n=1 Tax=Dasania marina TaxID=471499 RepID=UPI0030DD968B|tara:strand:+ start:66212 stop:67123 length:912 start_codon:yes stop_codon:yes gene_type:complete
MEIQLRHLRYFIAVAEELSFRQAAEKLHVSQPALSLQVAQLEEILGACLLKRNKRSVTTLTKEGVLFLNEAQLILKQVESSVALVQQMSENQPLSIGIPNYHSFQEISDTLHNFSQTCPEIELDVHEMQTIDTYRALANENLHAGFVILPVPEESNLKTIPIATNRYYICVSSSHPAYHCNQANPEVFENTNLYIFNRETSPEHHDKIVSSLKSAGFKMNIKYGSPSMQAQHSLVVANLGACLALESALLPDGIKALPIPPQILSHELALAWCPKNTHPSLPILINSLTKNKKSGQQTINRIN